MGYSGHGGFGGGEGGGGWWVVMVSACGGGKEGKGKVAVNIIVLGVVEMKGNIAEVQWVGRVY